MLAEEIYNLWDWLLRPHTQVKNYCILTLSHSTIGILGNWGGGGGGGEGEGEESRYVPSPPPPVLIPLPSAL